MKKFAIVYGEYATPIQKKAVEKLSEILLDATAEYPICTNYADFEDRGEFRCIYIGTKGNNPYIKQNSTKSLTKSEEYYIKVVDDTIIIEGYDDAGVLYGCVDFYGKYLVHQRYTHDQGTYLKNIFEETLPDFEYTSCPAIKERGLWTWGHVIYDFKGYIDNMLTLKMNTLTIWNDFVPINAKEMLEYAHSCNIKIYWGFPWGWDTKCGEIDVQNINAITDSIIEVYEKSYAPLGGDGIYFQSFTELPVDSIGDILIAEAVTNFVNNTACKLLEKYPHLELQFGLHATSVKDKLEYISKVNPKIRIVWEDCGSFPFHYMPSKIIDFDETADLTEKTIALRGDEEKWGAVLKGFTCLDWFAFEHPQGAYHIGLGTNKWKNNRTVRKENIWRYVQAYWLRNADKAYEMIQKIQKQSGGNICLSALVEDGMFESHLYYPVALFGEMMWDCKRDLKDIMCDMALNDCIEFV